MHKSELNKLLAYAVQKDASDIHLSSGSPPIFRIHGRLRRLEKSPLTSEGLRNVFGEILTENQQQVLSKNLELDFEYLSI